MGYPRTVLALTSAAILVGLGLRAQPARDPLAEPFKGVTTNGAIVEGLFPIRATGVTTAPVRRRRPGSSRS